MKAITLEGICKSFGEPPIVVLENFNAIFRAGITCIMGQSGIGKTTLIRILANLTSPDTGKISGLDDIKLACVFQEDRLLEGETALTNVLFVTNNAKKNTPRAIALLTQVNLGDSIHKKVRDLSGGMKRRVALCRALIADYDLLILDEPFKGLDEETKQNAITLLQQEIEKGAMQKIIICITHDVAEATALTETIITM